MYKYLFGPVPSRRLGKSLGIDLVEAKTCNMNCVFCECGVTKEFPQKRDSYVNMEELKKEIKSAIKELKIDCLTFSGNGEPTMSRDIGDTIKFIKSITDIPVVVITNSGLLYDDTARKEILDADIIIPTINSGFNETFKKINRPDEKINIENIKNGIKKLSYEFKGKIFIETFIIEGLNDSDRELDELADYYNSISYTKIQLNTLDRQGTEDWVKSASKKRMEEVKLYLENKKVKNIEIVGKFKISDEEKIVENNELIKNMKSKRVYSEDEMESIFKRK